MKLAGVVGVLTVAVWAAPLAQAAVDGGPRPPGAGLPPNAGRLGTVDAAAAERGAGVYRTSCGFCHGAEGRGGVGPTLMASLFVMGDPSGKPLHDFLQVGKPEAGMPPFREFTPAQVGDIVAFLQMQATARSARPIDPTAILVGDAQAGRAYFNGEGGCARCHSPERDLKGVGTRMDPMALQARMINPKTMGRGPGQPASPPPVAVKVTSKTGPVVQGRLVQVNEFFVTLVDSGGRRRTIPRRGAEPKVELDDPLDYHRQHMMRWNDDTMWNMTAYLTSLK